MVEMKAFKLSIIIIGLLMVSFSNTHINPQQETSSIPTEDIDLMIQQSYQQNLVERMESI